MTDIRQGDYVRFRRLSEIERTPEEIQNGTFHDADWYADDTPGWHCVYEAEREGLVCITGSIVPFDVRRFHVFDWKRGRYVSFTGEDAQLFINRYGKGPFRILDIDFNGKGSLQVHIDVHAPELAKLGWFHSSHLCPYDGEEPKPSRPKKRLLKFRTRGVK